MSYRMGARVPKTGSYACAQCGNVLTLEAAEEFPQCQVCFTEDEGEWDLVESEAPQLPDDHAEEG